MGKKILVEIKGKRSEMDEDLLEKRTGGRNDERENTDWVEYWLNGELVHRSVNVRLK